VKTAAATAFIVVAWTLEFVALSIAIVGGVAGVGALLFVQRQAGRLHSAVEAQREELRAVERRVNALEPPAVG
jgi:hypothetical protein